MSKAGSENDRYGAPADGAFGKPFPPLDPDTTNLRREPCPILERVCDTTGEKEDLEAVQLADLDELCIEVTNLKEYAAKRTFVLEKELAKLLKHKEEADRAAKAAAARADEQRRPRGRPKGGAQPAALDIPDRTLSTGGKAPRSNSPGSAFGGATPAESPAPDGQKRKRRVREDPADDLPVAKRQRTKGRGGDTTPAGDDQPLGDLDPALARAVTADMPMSFDATASEFGGIDETPAFAADDDPSEGRGNRRNSGGGAAGGRVMRTQTAPVVSASDTAFVPETRSRTQLMVDTVSALEQQSVDLDGGDDAASAASDTTPKPRRKRSSVSNNARAKRAASGAAGRRRRAGEMDMDEEEEEEEAFEPEEEVATGRTDRPEYAFWKMVEPYFQDVTPDHLKHLMPQEKWEGDSCFATVPLGRHFAQKWADEDADVDKKAKKKGKETLPAPDPVSESGLGLLTERLLSATVDPLQSQAKTEFSAEFPWSADAVAPPPSREEALALEDRIKQELASIGLVDMADVDFSMREDDEVSAELRSQVRKLYKSIESNNKQKTRLSGLVCATMGEQQRLKEMRKADRALETAYKKYMKPSVKKSMNEQKRLACIRKALGEWQAVRAANQASAAPTPTAATTTATSAAGAVPSHHPYANAPMPRHGLAPQSPAANTLHQINSPSFGGMAPPAAPSSPHMGLAPPQGYAAPYGTRTAHAAAMGGMPGGGKGGVPGGAVMARTTPRGTAPGGVPAPMDLSGQMPAGMAPRAGPPGGMPGAVLPGAPGGLAPPPGGVMPASRPVVNISSVNPAVQLVDRRNGMLRSPGGGAAGKGEMMTGMPGAQLTAQYRAMGGMQQPQPGPAPLMSPGGNVARAFVMNGRG